MGDSDMVAVVERELALPDDQLDFGYIHVACYAKSHRCLPMNRKIILARTVQAGFWITGLTFLTMIYFDVGGIQGTAVALLATLPFITSIIFLLKCERCGVSYYFDPSMALWNISGVNLIKAAPLRCAKCGYPLSEESN